MYEEYIDALTKKKEDVEPYTKRLELAEKAQRMVERVESVQIIDSMVVDKDKFLSAYTLSGEGGTLTTYNAFFNTSSPVSSVVYKNEKEDKIYYSQPVNLGGYQLFTQSRLLDNWGDEKALPQTINAGGDENYPYVLSDGVTIYFASKANGALGGYDLFVTRYNTNSDTYLTPEQLGMPFNSFANDYMMVIDEVKGLGWFVSDRNQPENKVCVYLFIPDEQRTRIEGEDIELKRSRALIASIADTWKPGSNYKDLISLAHKEISTAKNEVKKDFTFVITDKLVYYTLNEIKNPEAKSYYEKVITLNKQLQAVNEKLNGLRDSYTKGNQARKAELKQTILQAEDELYDLQGQPEEWEKKARNAEINFLKQNNNLL